ncbi:hypothetical protein LI019_20370 [Enterocloster bolteae]|nr:hypothetical protein [Enterocloster bolteae]
MRQSLTLHLGVPYDIVQTNKKGECNICVALDFVDVDGIVVIVDAAAAAAVTAVAVVDAEITAVAAETAAVAAAAVAVAAVAVAVEITAAAMTSVQAPGVRHSGKASAMDIGKASTMPPGAIIRDAAAPHRVQPEGPDQP